MGLPQHSGSPRSKQRNDDVAKYSLVILSSVCILLLLLNARLTLWRTEQQDSSAVSPLGANDTQQSPFSSLEMIDDPEIWAQGPPDDLTAQQQQLAAALGPAVLADLKQLCGRCLYRTLTSYVRAHSFGRVAVVLTGDIPAMWIRDSAVQMATYLPRITRRPALRTAIEGAIRAQAYFILQDPWANAYNPQYVPPTKLPKHERQLGRGGWVWTRNFELDSIAYFFNFLWNYHQTPSIWQPGKLLLEPAVHDAVVLLLKVLMIEQHHEQLSPYRYSELPRDGLGAPTGYTGMVWSAFRPSDDPQVYGYNVPDNMYLWGSLRRLLKLNSVTWQDTEVEGAIVKLLEDIHNGIMTHGVIEVDPGVKAYAYEVDGLGQALVDFDDPNLPSLLALPLLGYTMYDHALYDTTRRRILSSDTNPFYFSGSELHGLGSPHTETEFVWPLATAVDAITTKNTTRQVELLAMLIKMAAGNGLVHESVHVDSTTRFSRAEFGWANAMTVVMLEQLLGVDCDLEAERFRLTSISDREKQEMGFPPNGGADIPQYYEQLEAGIVHVGTNGGAESEDLSLQAPNWQQLLDDQAQQELLQKVLGMSAEQSDAPAGQTGAQQQSSTSVQQAATATGAGEVAALTDAQKVEQELEAFVQALQEQMQKASVAAVPAVAAAQGGVPQPTTQQPETAAADAAAAAGQPALVAPALPKVEP